jgi:hypothetical protein
VWPALVTAAAGAAHLAVALRTDRFVATVGEARLAAAIFGERGAQVGDIPLPAADRFAVRQLAAVETLLPTAGVPAIDAARWAALLLGFVSVVLLWPVLRDLAVGPAPSAVASALVGVVPPVVALHAGVSAAAPAAMWLVLAAALAALVRGHAVPAAVAAAMAALTSPLAAAALLALAAHLLYAKAVGAGLPTAARILIIGTSAAAALAIAAAAAGTGPLAGVGGPIVGTGTTLVVVAVGLVLAWLARTRTPELRPAITPVLLMLAVAIMPGTGRSAALLIALPFLAVLVAVLLEPVAARIPAGRRAGVAAVPLTALAVALVVGLLAVVNARPVPSSSLAGWASSELGPDAVVRADALDRADLLAGGVPGERLRDLAEPAAPGELLMVSERPGNGVDAPDVPGCVGLATLAAVPRGAGGAPTTICATGPVEPMIAEQAERARFGALLVSNPALQLAPPAVEALEAGIVDPRVVLMLAGLAGPRQLEIADFPLAPLEPPYAVRRHVLLTTVNGLPAAGDPLPLVRTWLSGQQPPFVPTTIEPDGSALLVGYPAPVPTGLIAR